MILGGYQKIDLSPADLTASTLRVGGLSKACAGANGKPALVKTPDGVESFGVVTKNGDDYNVACMNVTGGVTNIAVDGDDDSFTITNGTGYGTPGVDLYGYDGSATSKFYECPSDGVVRIKVAATASNYVQVNSCKGATQTGTILLMKVYGNTGGICYYSFPVKKGMWLICGDNGTGNAIEFFATI